MLHDSKHGLCELLCSLQQEQMAIASVCDHISFPNTSLLSAHLKQSRRLRDIFSLSFQSQEREEHTPAILCHVWSAAEEAIAPLYVFALNVSPT